jgi:undecaprenyl-diphosphatase
VAANEEQPDVPAAPPEGRSRRWASATSGVRLWASAALFLCLLATLAAFFDRFPGDESIARATQAIDLPAFGGFLTFVNFLGDTWLYMTLTLALAGAFVLARAVPEAVLVLLTFAPRIFSGMVKGWVERPRPSPELLDVTHDASGFSFPSGHTVGTAALFGVLFFLMPAIVPWRPLRWALQAGCLLAVVAAGPARVYIGVHWPSDVFAGYLLALLVLAPPLAVYRALRSRPPPDSGA